VSPWLSDLFLRSQSDERLVSLACAGHDQAFVAIVERYKRQLIAFARHLGTEGRAEDVVQQAFLSAFAAIKAGAEIEHLSGWLHQIVRNAAARAATRSPVEAELRDDAIAADSTEEEVERRLRAQSALADVARLPDRQRDALVLTALHGISGSEVALAMGLSEGAVRQLVRRARTSLRAAATAITPYPLAAWAAGLGPTGEGSAAVTSRIAEAAVGAGSAGGLAVKAGVIALATGVVATGVIVSHGRHQRSLHAHRARSAPEVAAIIGHTRQVASTGVVTRGAGHNTASSPPPASRPSATSSSTHSSSKRPFTDSQPQHHHNGHQDTSSQSRSGSSSTDGKSSSSNDYGGTSSGGDTSTTPTTATLTTTTTPTTITSLDSSVPSTDN
jgi:RNA polymerase sigma factor (sigma-70 family)